MSNSQSSTNPEEPNTTNSAPARPRSRQNDSLEFPESDPWSSPALHKGHHHSEQSNPPPRANGISGVKSLGPERDLPSHSRNDPRSGSSADNTASPQQSSRRNPVNHGEIEGWNSYEAPTANAYSNQPGSTLGSEGFGRSGNVSGSHNRSSEAIRPTGSGGVTGSGVEEVVIITLLPDKEGMFMFQHRNYQVSSVRRNSKVVRRFSDFVWLLDCLHKRYPFRQLPLLPPKRVAGKKYPRS